MNRTMRICLMTTAISALMGAAAWATDEDVNVEAQFRQAIILTENNQVDFTPGTASVDYTDVANITNVTDFVTLATNDAIVAAGRLSTGLTNGTAGQVTIAGEPNTSVDISCRSTGMALSDGIGTTLNFLQARVSVDAAGTGDPFGTPDSICAGVGTTPIPFTLSGAGAGIVTIGGRINPVASMPSGVYTTANTGTGGVPLTLRVVYTP
jgi:hypothetical protein